MDKALLQRVLMGDEEAIALFGECEHCAVIDWRDGLTEIVAAVQAFLPEGYLTIGGGDDSPCQLLVQGKAPRSIALMPPVKQEELLVSVNEALQPEFELRQFRPIDGDGYSVFVAPAAVWADMDRTCPQATERLFLTTARLAAYWSKGYLARLRSKP